MEEKLNNILKFLRDNKKYNKKLQEQFALNSIGFKQEPFEKLVPLLYDTINTQRSPNIDYMAEFIKSIYVNKSNLNTFNDFFTFIVGETIEEYSGNDIYNHLFKSIKKIKGWGPKTSALLIKNIYNYHYSFNTLEDLTIWNDVPKLTSEDEIYLPVDAVIITIFKKLSSSNKLIYSFANINTILHENFNNEEMILFDDLWFWGFITQDSSKDEFDDAGNEIPKWDEKRKMYFNENKYLSIKESNKDKIYIEEIKEKANLFLELFNDKENSYA